LINPIANPDPISYQELVLSLFEREGFVPPDFFESRWSNTLAVMLEKQLVRLLNPLTNILHCLRTDQLPEWIPFSELGDMSLKFGTVQVLAPYPVVPAMKGNAMVINHPSSIDSTFKVFIPLALI
jgi:hypothetical protein